ncbi:MAG: hypothetical protein V2A58_16710 [Planctomycetota bacterium]
MDWTKVLIDLANSNAVVALIGAGAVALLRYLFMKRPEWEGIFATYKPLLIDAVRAAEQAIPDTAEGKAAQKADAALKYVLRVHGSLPGSEDAVKAALDKAHAAVTAKGLPLGGLSLAGIVPE